MPFEAPISTLAILVGTKPPKLRSRLLNFRKTCVRNGLRLTTWRGVGIWKSSF